MSKYSKEVKLAVVEYCIYQHHGYIDASKHFNIPSKTLILEWVRKYKERGPEGLLKNSRTSYDGKFKQYVVEYMHNNHLSATETAIKFNLANHSVVLKWERIYYEEGPQTLYEERRGRSRKMSSKPKKKKIDKEEDLIDFVWRMNT